MRWPINRLWTLNFIVSPRSFASSLPSHPTATANLFPPIQSCYINPNGDMSEVSPRIPFILDESNPCASSTNSVTLNDGRVMPIFGLGVYQSKAGINVLCFIISNNVVNT